MQTIFITGASSGIGKTTAKYFQEKGWNVIATMRKPEAEKELNVLANVLVTYLDVQERASIAKAIEAGLQKFGKIHVVLNNAGYSLSGIFEATSEERIFRQFDVNVLGLFAVTKAFIPYFREQQAGIFVNISSVGGKVAFPAAPVYMASKFAVEGFSESLHYELAPLGIKIKIIEPGIIQTDFSGRSMDWQYDEHLKEYEPFFKKLQAANNDSPNNSGTPELVARVIYQAVTDESGQLRYIAGADAEQMIALRKELEDEEFIHTIKQNFGM